jgi:hypothetical protein
VVVGCAWGLANLNRNVDHGSILPNALAASLLVNFYALVLGAELIARGLQANSFVRANFGLLIIAALAIARFFDSDLGFISRGMGFIFVGVMFLLGNWMFFRKQQSAALTSFVSVGERRSNNP